ncbi:MAG: Glucose-6-phosphate isomerase [Gemmatimonadaceae bacterium]|nr:Glucose-6-phosphate isomerase [Gemmatimonadaceae bacterium]
MIHLDYSNMMSDAVAGGLDATTWGDASRTFRRAWSAVSARRARGDLGFFDLPSDTALLAQSQAVVAATRGRYDDVVVLGIGGSALGPIALRTALRPHGWNTLDVKSRDGWPRLHVLDNVDPATISAVLTRVALDRTLFLVTSKSGGTAETMAQYLVVRGRLAQAGLPLREHLIFITDPAKGALRPIARAEGITALDIPPDVGGRFSVLTPVGVLPAALIGIDVVALLSGAEAMRQRCETDRLQDNISGTYATLQWLADTVRDRRIHVLMPYSDPLRDMAAWFVQLWAESLGKVQPGGAHVGPTPLAALGATDQHAQVQLFMEGPADKTVTFVSVSEVVDALPIPSAHGEVPDLAYLGGHRIGELLHVEHRATAGALAQRGRLNMTIELDRVDAWHVGGLMMLLEIATAVAGDLYGIDAFDQPGVELGKRFAYAMLGRPGFDDARQEWDSLPKRNPKYFI